MLIATFYKSDLIWFLKIVNNKKRIIMKKLFIAAFIFVSTFTTNVFAEVKMGIILGFTGPIESLTPAMAASAELAFKKPQTLDHYLVEKKFQL